MYHDEIKFHAGTDKTKDENRDPIITPIFKTVFGKKKSVRQSEFYQASRDGLKPEIMFEVWQLDYENYKELTFEGVEYRVIRTYDIDLDKMEIICEGLVR